MRASVRSIWLGAALALVGGASICTTAHAQVAEAQAQAAGSPWTLLDAIPADDQAREPWIRADAFNPARLDAGAMRALLAQAPMEFTPEAFAQPLAIDLPHPDGGFETFLIVESPVMEAALQAEFPEIRTYAGQGVDDPAASVRLDLTPAGFHAQVLSPDQGSWYIDPYSRGDAVLHTSYFKSDLANNHWGQFTCNVLHFDDPADGGDDGFPTRTPRTDALLRTYRLAVTCTGEYAQFHGGTVNSAQAAIVTMVNRVTGVYEVEVGVRMTLIANNSTLVFTNPSTDPYSNNDAFSLLSQSQTQIDNRIGSANYDIGHIVSTGGGGVAGLGVVCRAGQKARGVTGLPAPTGDPFYIDYVAHEMGHQFGANHTFNSSTSSCGGGNRNGSTAYEPGSGSTIMSYAGICGVDNVQNNSDPYFHSISFDEIRAYITSGAGGGCDVTVNTGNSTPDVNAGPNYTIPSRTPFVLTPTSVTDADSGDVLTVGWEQRNLGASISLATGDNGTSPIVRSRGGTSGLSRSVPPLSNVLNNTAARADIVPTTNRTMTFRAIVRDNRGGIGTDDMTVTSVAAAGPFQVTFPNTSTTLEGPITVTWDVAGTTANGINCANVRISLSIDGGTTFPFELAASTPNDGTQSVTLPTVTTTQARIKIEAIGNIFYDISNANFTIENLIDLPIADDFDASGSLDPALWVSGLGASVSTQGTGEPSGANAVRIEQTGELRSFPLQIGTFANSNPDIELSFFWQSQGAESNDLLFVEYNDGGAIWQLIGFVQSTGSTEPFQRYAVLLPPGAKFNNYAIRLRAAGNATNDLWFVDNFRLGLPEVVSCPADWDNSGGQPDSSDFLAYLNDFAAQDPAADLAPPGGDGSWDSSDFLAYLNLYSQGC